MPNLRHRANQRLAHYLRSLGVGPDVIVGLCVERSIEMVVGLLGILKAGGAYLPLDPEYPPERLAFMLEDAQASVLLTQSALRDRASAHTVVFLDQEWARIAEHAQSAPITRVLPHNLAYVIYTSGSTGEPKGVMVLQQSVVNLLGSIAQHPGLATHDVVLSGTQITFDIAALEIYLPLVVGALVVVASRATVTNGDELKRLIERSGATLFQGTPATWQLLNEGDWRPCKELRMLCGGEYLIRELANRLVSDGRHAWNLYGPTETTIWSTIHQIREQTSQQVPIGRPISNTRLYVLDEWLEPVPIGVSGELYIGGWD